MLGNSLENISHRSLIVKPAHEMSVSCDIRNWKCSALNNLSGCLLTLDIGIELGVIEIDLLDWFRVLPFVAIVCNLIQ